MEQRIILKATLFQGEVHAQQVTQWHETQVTLFADRLQYQPVAAGSNSSDEQVDGNCIAMDHIESVKKQPMTKRKDLAAAQAATAPRQLFPLELCLTQRAGAEPGANLLLATCSESETNELQRSVLLACKLHSKFSIQSHVAAAFSRQQEQPNEQSRTFGAGGSPLSNGKALPPPPAFIQFASSDSESDLDDSSRSNSVASEESFQTQLNRSDSRGLQMIRVTAEDEHGNKVSASFPVTTRRLADTNVLSFKLEAIQRLQETLTCEQCAQGGLLEQIKRRDAEFFGLRAVLPSGAMVYLTEDRVLLQHYLKDTSLFKSDEGFEVQVIAMNQVPLPTLEVHIVQAKTKTSDLSQRKYTVYVIEVNFNRMHWTVPRRFREFYKLDEQLRAKYNDQHDEQLVKSLPRLPHRHPLYTPTEGEFITKRRLKLERYLINLLSVPKVNEDVLLMAFLGVVSTSREPEIAKHDCNVIHITALHHFLNYGDIMLFNTKFNASIFQRTFTGKKYDHVGLVIPDDNIPGSLRILEATGEGIQSYPLKSRLMAYGREVSKRIVVRMVRTERNELTLARLTRFIKRVEGNPYSILGILQTRMSSGASATPVSKQINGLDIAGKGDDEHDHRSPTETGDSTASNDSAYDGQRPVVLSSSESDGSSSSPPTPMQKQTANGHEQVLGNDPSEEKRKYFCSSLVASAFKQLQWLNTTHSSSYFWPGSFEEGGEIEKYLSPEVSLGPETVVDCHIVEVGLAQPH